MAVGLENGQPPPACSEAPTNVSSSPHMRQKKTTFFLCILSSASNEIFWCSVLAQTGVGKISSSISFKAIGYLHKIMNYILFF